MRYKIEQIKHELWSTFYLLRCEMEREKNKALGSLSVQKSVWEIHFIHLPIYKMHSELPVIHCYVNLVQQGKALLRRFNLLRKLFIFS